MLKDFNLLISTSRGNEENTCSEAGHLLSVIGDTSATIDKTGVVGLITAKTTLNPFEVIKKFREILKESPWEFRYTLRVIPIERIVDTNLEEIQKTATELASKINQNETFRVAVEKRFTALPTKEIIEVAATNIDRKVDLKNPDKIVLIEIIGELTGISVIKPADILSVVKERT